MPVPEFPSRTSGSPASIQDAGQVEVLESFRSRKFGFFDPACSAPVFSFVAFIGQYFGQISVVAEALPTGFLGHRFGDLGGAGQVERLAGDADRRAAAAACSLIPASDGLGVLVFIGSLRVTTTLNTYAHLWPDSDESTRSAIDMVMQQRAEALLGGGEVNEQ